MQFYIDFFTALLNHYERVGAKQFGKAENEILMIITIETLNRTS